MQINDKREWTFTMVENDFIDNLDFTKNELLAYIALSRFSNKKDNSCFPSYNTIAKIMRCSRQTAIDSIESLVKKGVVEKTIRKTKDSNHNKTNIYTIVGVKKTNIKNQVNEEKKKRDEQIKELNKHKNIKLFVEVAPHIKLGRKQKIVISELDFDCLNKALDVSMVYGANTFNYVMEVYKTVSEDWLTFKYEQEKKELEEKFKRQMEYEKQRINDFITENENFESDIEIKNKKLLEKDSQDIQRKIFYTNEFGEYDENVIYKKEKSSSSTDKEEL